MECGGLDESYFNVTMLKGLSGVVPVKYKKYMKEKKQIYILIS